jgi:serine protease
MTNKEFSTNFSSLFVVIFIVFLAACGGSGGSDAAALNFAPIANFSIDVTSGKAPLFVNFNASASTDRDGHISSYNWDFGDGQTGRGVTTNHTFVNPGNFTVALTVIDDDGASNSASQVISVVDTFTSDLSGTVSSMSGSAKDSDVNDINATYLSNDTPAQAQPIPNPVNVGGYLNVANTGPIGRSFTSGDRSDFFRISMAASQTITVNIADHASGDLDLFVYYDDGSIDVLNPDFLSIGIGQTEMITVPQNGNYIIEVYAYSGYSNYNLSVGQGVASSSAESLVSTHDFVPGEVVVQFHDDVLTTSENRTIAARAVQFGFDARAGAQGRAMLMGLGLTTNRQKTFDTLGMTSNEGDAVRRFYSDDPDKQLRMDTLQVTKALRKRADVIYAEPNYLRHAKQVPTDTYYGYQWHYPLINLPSAWDVSTGSSNVIVAVVDTGVLLNHPDLQGQFSSDGGYDFILSDLRSQDGEPGIDANPDDPGDSLLPGSSSFHGTHVAGTVAAATSFTGGGIGVAGVAPGVKIMPLRAIGNGGGANYDILQAVRYAAGLSNDSGIVPAQKADVINMSIGGGGFSQAAQDVYTLARDAGVIIVAAAGNENSSSPSYPAAYDGVISVSAIDINKQLAPYSNFGSTIDVAAPGGDISNDVNGDGYADGVLSTIGNDSGVSITYIYNFLQGTSMASPHMAGVVALMKSVYNGLTPDHFDDLLTSGQIVDDLGAAGRDDAFGHGLINARKAVDAATSLAQGTATNIPIVSATPAALNFGTNATIAILSVTNGGSGSLSVTSIASDSAWLNVIADSVDIATQLGRYQVTVDRTDMAEGIYTANITITSSANSVKVPVIMQVTTQNFEPDVGYQYILLIDTATDNVAMQWEGNGQNGNYNFQFSNVTFSGEQSFYIVAGTDMNNDGFICDAGEACGAYLSLDQFKAISANDSHTGLDFISGFNIGLQSLSASDSDMRDTPIKRQQFKVVN